MMKVLFQGSMAEIARDMRNFLRMTELAQERVADPPAGPAVIRSKEDRLEYLKRAHAKLQAQKVAAVVPKSGKCDGCGQEFERLRKHAPLCKMKKMWEEDSEDGPAAPPEEMELPAPRHQHIGG